MLFPSKTHDAKRKLIKQLFAMLDLDGTYGSWRQNNTEAAPLPGDATGPGPLIPLAGSTHVFPVRTFFRQQPDRTMDPKIGRV